MAQIDLSKLATEQINPNTKSIDQLSTIDMVTLINQEDQKVALAIEKALPMIAMTIDLAHEALQQGGRIFYLGAGTSGRLGVLDASECPPTFGVDESLVVGVIAGGDYALRHAVEGAEDDPDGGVRDLQAHNFHKNDILIGLTASGRTPYVHGGLKYAHSLGAKTALVACSKQLEETPYIDVLIEVLPGAEIITGSTRLKSGTSQKIVVNMISTGTMIRQGKVFGNLMVDVKPSNEKLVERQIRIVQEATGASREVAMKALQESGRHSKTAILMILADISYEEAVSLLSQHEGFISQALANKNLS
ncbi:N-acetylmuramic acid 6-phosphate etherase [Entomospira entomophila]|uniref:N-acetylmuramic acid 6-phosphate etherase n=1 Tax=Entomospira entomophila TaxID=2719988 RepID=A0A968KW84_9SPIO|nr:N-acetylmuramic acid 6-phosphate etherase [Entomospira entomophilus]NIZ40575.1 N-acetylmuramic acid 6-phosphate etherase [Entomospira entomophilus]WDI36133.1 N-acetylmuramic acid 6-phosphate etherase [Entomospira entomophilus]